MFLDECERAARITEPRAKGIVASVGCDELSSAPLQSRPASARCHLDAAGGSREGVSIGEVLARVTVVDHAIATR
jgi:hypothetical protein